VLDIDALVRDVHFHTPTSVQRENAPYVFGMCPLVVVSDPMDESEATSAVNLTQPIPSTSAASSTPPSLSNPQPTLVVDPLLDIWRTPTGPNPIGRVTGFVRAAEQMPPPYTFNNNYLLNPPNPQSEAEDECCRNLPPQHTPGWPDLADTAPNILPAIRDLNGDFRFLPFHLTFDPEGTLDPDGEIMDEDEGWNSVFASIPEPTDEPPMPLAPMTAVSLDPSIPSTSSLAQKSQVPIKKKKHQIATVKPMATIPESSQLPQEKPFVSNRDPNDHSVVVDDGISFEELDELSMSVSDMQVNQPSLANTNKGFRPALPRNPK
jgi:hypothetical protein